MKKLKPQEEEITIADEVILIVDDASFTDRKRVREIFPLLLKSMEKEWKFRTSQNKRYYISSKDNEIFQLKSGDFLAYISYLTGLNQLDPLSAKLIKALDTHIRVRAKKEDIEIEFRTFSHYNREKNELYIYNNKDIVYITKSSIKVVDNGYNNVLFRKTQHSPWKFIKDVKSDVNYLQTLIKSINFSESILPPKDIYLIFEYYVYSLFLPELFEWKVILNIIGDMGSWKSFVLSMLYKIFYWKDKKLSTMPSKDDGLEVMLANNVLVFFDNVELKWLTLKSKIDIICAAATWVAANKRKLYKDWEEFSQDLSTNIGFTAIEPEYNRKDLSERSLVFFLDKRKSYSSGQVSQNKYVENRDVIMSMICYQMMDILKNIEIYDDYESNFRMADFSNFLFNNFKRENKRMVNIFEKLTKIQQSFTNSNDLLLILLEDMFDSWEELLKPEKFYSANELNKIFTLYSARKENRNIKYPHNAKTLWRALNDGMYSYKNTANISIVLHKKWWNKRTYCISKV